MNKYKTILVLLISSLAITGVSFIDGKIWDILFICLGMLTYSIVGLLFSLGLLKGSEDGKKAYPIVFIILIGIGYFVYKCLMSIKNWILSWPLWVKIFVPSFLGLLIILTVVLMILINKKNKTGVVVNE